MSWDVQDPFPDLPGGDGSWPDALSIPQDEQDIDVFALVDCLGLGEDLPDTDAIPLQGSHANTCTADVAPHDSTQPARWTSSESSRKADRIRARNRLAQAKYRQKAKV